MAIEIIALVSEQFVPNLMAAVKFRPSRLYLLRSPNHEFQTGMDNFSAYLRTQLTGDEVGGGSRITS